MDTPAPGASPNFIARSVGAMLRRTRHSLSPWVQRLIATPTVETAPAASPRPGVMPAPTPARAPGPVAFTSVTTQTLINRVQRVNTNSTVWRGNLGSLNPSLVDDFAANIADRFPDKTQKFQMQPLGGAESEKLDPLPLINGLALQAAEQPQAPERPAWSYFPEWPPAPATPAAPAPNFPELGTPAPTPSVPAQRKPVGRPLSRVEEIQPDSSKEPRTPAPITGEPIKPPRRPASSPPAAASEPAIEATNTAPITEPPAGEQPVARPPQTQTRTPRVTPAPAASSDVDASPPVAHWPELGTPAPTPHAAPPALNPAPEAAPTPLPSLAQPLALRPASSPPAKTEPTAIPELPTSASPVGLPLTSRRQPAPTPETALPSFPALEESPTAPTVASAPTPPLAPAELVASPTAETPPLPLTQPRVLDLIHRAPAGEPLSTPDAIPALDAQPLTPPLPPAQPREPDLIHRAPAGEPPFTPDAAPALDALPTGPDVTSPSAKPLTPPRPLAQPRVLDLINRAPAGEPPSIPDATPTLDALPTGPDVTSPPAQPLTPPLPLTQPRVLDLIHRAPAGEPPSTPDAAPALDALPTEPSVASPPAQPLTPPLPLAQPRVLDLIHRAPAAEPLSASEEASPLVSAPVREAASPAGQTPPSSADKLPSITSPIIGQSTPPPSDESQVLQPSSRASQPAPEPEPEPEHSLISRALSKLSLPLTASWPLTVRRMIQRLFAPPAEDSAPPDQPTSPAPEVAAPRVILPFNRPIGEMAVNVNRAAPTVAQRAVRVNLMAAGWRFKTAASESAADLSLIHRALSDLGQTSGGRPLQRETREHMENTLGRDFSRVRIHTAQLSPLNVQAAAQGDDVYFDAGQDNFDSPTGLALLGHELTHVAQSGAAPSQSVARMAAPVPATNLMRVADDEAQADQVERSIFSNASAPLPLSGPVAVPRVPARPAAPTMAQRAQETGTPEQEETPGQQFAQHLKESLPVGLSLPPSNESPGDLTETLTSSVAEATQAAADAQEDAPEKVTLDLDNLARQVYPLIKRLLAIERERSTTR